MIFQINGQEYQLPETSEELTLYALNTDDPAELWLTVTAILNNNTTEQDFLRLQAWCQQNPKITRYLRESRKAYLTRFGRQKARGF